MAVPDPFPLFTALVPHAAEFAKYHNRKRRQEEFALRTIWKEVVTVLGERGSPLMCNIEDTLLSQVDYVDLGGKYSTSFKMGELRPDIALRYRVSLLILGLISQQLSKDQTRSFITTILDSCKFKVPSPGKEYKGDPYDDLYLRKVVSRLVTDTRKLPRAVKANAKRFAGCRSNRKWKGNEFSRNLGILKEKLTNASNEKGSVKDQDWMPVVMPQSRVEIAIGPWEKILVPENKETQKLLCILSYGMKVGRILNPCKICTTPPVNDGSNARGNDLGTIWRACIVPHQ